MIKDTSQQDTMVNKPKPNRIKQVVVGTLIVGAVTMGWKAVGSWQTNEVSIARSQLKLATVERGDLMRDIVTTGKIVAANAPIVYSPEAGLVTLLVKPGDMVKAGQQVAMIESPQLMANFSQQKTLVQQLTSDVSREKLSARRTQLALQQKAELAKVSLAAAEREARRAEVSIKRNLISQIDYEKAQDDLAKAKLTAHHAEQEAKITEDTLAFEVKNKELQLKAVTQELAELQRKVDELAIASTVEGIVGNWLVEQKAKVTSNESLMMIVDLSAYEAELQVPETFADEIGLGMPVEISMSDKQLKGQLASISPEVISNQVTARVRISDAGDINLRQNQRISARIILEEKRDVLMVRRGQFYQSGAGKLAYRVDDNIAKRISMVSGATSMTHIEIVEGLNEGDTLVVSDLEIFDNKAQALLY
ncbi:efflux RND transporter periplasmic adaptor subunit [Thalassotalea ganghwensis]